MANPDGTPPADGSARDAIIRPVAFEPPRGPVFRRRARLNPTSILIALGLLLCAAAVWFILTARSVYLEIVPPQAGVEIDAWQIQIGDRHLLRPGIYPLQVTAEGYHALETTLTVGAESNQQSRFELRKLPGHLKVGSTPGSATILIDNRERGTTPATIRDLEPGEHAIEVRLERYLPHTARVQIEGRDTEQVFDVKLAPAFAVVSITSKPEGAEVRVDEDVAGRTPLQPEIMQGEHELLLSLEGHNPRREKIIVTAGQPLQLPAYELQIADAVVQLESRPSGANVTANGEFRGQTPLEVALAPGQSSVLKLFKPGFQPAQRSVTLKSGAREQMRIDLVADSSNVEFIIEPSDAELLIDGATRGRGTQTIELNTQPHSIRVQKPGFVSHETKLTPRAGMAQQFRIRLLTEAEAKAASVKPVITSATGQALRLFRPDGSITMGASRREPGRRANEFVREVRLQRPFYLSEHEVRNSDFKTFKPDHNSGTAQRHSLDGAEQPVAAVSWAQAARYCNWLSVRDGLPPFYVIQGESISGFNRASTGYRLPTEAEWDWATRGAKGEATRFPWGDTLPPPAKTGNYADQSAANVVAQTIADYQDGFAASAPVGSFAPNGKGLFDLGGNVAEWMHDYYDIEADPASVPQDPLGPLQGQHHVIRGSSWAHGTLTELRWPFRDYGADGRDDVGFRIARYLE